jgi:hypothetical protein
MDSKGKQRSTNKQVGALGSAVPSNFERNNMAVSQAGADTVQYKANIANLKKRFTTLNKGKMAKETYAY